MFVQGHYAAGWPSAGMLGYVQADSCAKWLERLATGLEDRRTEIGCGNTADWKSAGWADEGLETTRVSYHQRTPQGLGRIEIFHVLLACL
jgi:hypothetical protein